jgi:lysophospholipase L1-like esterase
MKKLSFLIFSLFLPFFCLNNLAISGENQKAWSAISPAISLLLIGDAESVGYYFYDNFQDGNADGWVTVNDSGRASSWVVENGKYKQNSPNNLNVWELSYPLGSFAYLDDSDSFNRSNYYAAANIRSLQSISGSSESVGIMVRYNDPANYLRVLISKSMGTVRLEKRVNDDFSTLAFNGRPPGLGSTIGLKVYVIDNQVFVYINNEPVFSASDPDLAGGGPLARGTVALFTHSPAEFDDIIIGRLAPVPRMIIAEPVAYSVLSTSENPSSHSINVFANAVNVPAGGGVRFTLDSTTSDDDYTAPYSGNFTGVSPGEHQVAAKIIYSSGQPIFDYSGKDQDTNTNIGIGGKYLVMFGDSITNGVGDDSNNVAIGTQNYSTNGKNLNRGIAPVLNDLISSRVSLPVVVYNEGLGGTTAQQGLSRLDSTIDRHNKNQLYEKIWLVLFGTNDSSGTLPVTAANFKNRINNIILGIKANGDVPILGKVPYAKDVPESRLNLIQDYNDAIDELVITHDLVANPPDFYSYFLNNASQLYDDVHPDGVGYGTMAKMWFCSLVISGVLPGATPDYCTDYQY